MDDLAEACLLALERYSGEVPLNVGTGNDVTIADLAQLVAQSLAITVNWSSILASRRCAAKITQRLQVEGARMESANTTHHRP